MRWAYGDTTSSIYNYDVRYSNRKKHIINIDERLCDAVDSLYNEIEGEDLMEILESIIKEFDKYANYIEDSLLVKAEAVKFRNKHEDILNGYNKICFNRIAPTSGSFWERAAVGDW